MAGREFEGAFAARDVVGDGAIYEVDAALVYEPTGVHSGRMTGGHSMMVISRESVGLVAKFMASMRWLIRVGE